MQYETATSKRKRGLAAAIDAHIKAAVTRSGDVPESVKRHIDRVTDLELAAIRARAKRLAEGKKKK